MSWPIGYILLLPAPSVPGTRWPNQWPTLGQTLGLLKGKRSVGIVAIQLAIINNYTRWNRHILSQRYPVIYLYLIRSIIWLTPAASPACFRRYDSRYNWTRVVVRQCLRGGGDGQVEGGVGGYWLGYLLHEIITKRAIILLTNHLRMDDMAIEFISGNLAGWSLVTTGMPLDLIKTKLQLNKDISIQYLKQLISHRGGFFKAFYRGASSMYLFIGVATAIEFTVFETFVQITNKLNFPKEAELMASGFMAGIASSMIYTPIEFAKIRTQIDQSSQKLGSAQRMFNILKKYKFSGLRKIYTGLPYTMLKEGPGLAMCFGGFHVCMMDLFGEKVRQEASLVSQVCSAFIAGLIYNFWGYPFDTFKTNLQSGKDITVKQMIANKFWKQKSYKQGMLICLMRGLIVDSTNLTVYERAKNFSMKLFKKHPSY